MYFLLGRRKPQAAPAVPPAAEAAAAGAGAGAGAGAESDDETESVGEPCKMVMVVRMDLKMGKGKIAAQVCCGPLLRAALLGGGVISPVHTRACLSDRQCGHAVLGAYQEAQKQHQHYIDAWEEYGQKKIAVKV